MLTRVYYGFPLYFNDPEKTTEALTDDGFLRSGDLALLDDCHNVIIKGRIKDVIKYRGYTISPTSLEELLVESELVADCAVVGKPDPNSFQVPTAFVALSDIGKEKEEELVAKELKQLVASRVTEYKQIRFVYFLDHIPRTPFGKPMYSTLREKFQ